MYKRQQQPFISDRQLEGALERITMGLSAKPLQDSAKKRLIAYHEVGHALVAALLPAANKLDKVTILPRGAAGGYTRFMPDEEKLDSGLITRASCLADLVVSLGIIRHPKQIVYHVGQDLVVNGVDIYGNINDATGHWKKQEYHDFGKSTGSALRLLVIGKADEQVYV